MAKEILGLRLATLHNLHFMLSLMREIRDAILAGTFSVLKEEFLAHYEIVPPEARQRNRGARGQGSRGAREQRSRSPEQSEGTGAREQQE
jgi:queuine tRNA-ribosyltransferase